MSRTTLRCAFFSIYALLLGCQLISESHASVPPVDLVVYGRVWTGDSTKPWGKLSPSPTIPSRRQKT